MITNFSNSEPQRVACELAEGGTQRKQPAESHPPALVAQPFRAGHARAALNAPNAHLFAKRQQAFRPELSAPKHDAAAALLDGFEIPAWMTWLSGQVLGQYAKGPGSRRLQTGLAWRSFKNHVEGRSELDMIRLLGGLLRYAGSGEQDPARLLLRAYIPLSLEHDAFGTFIGVDTLTRNASERQRLLVVHRTLRRWCDWIESLAHLQAHVSRETASRPSVSADTAIIRLWPLVKRHKWGERELIQVLCAILHLPETCVLGRDTKLFECLQQLGLRLPSRSDVSAGAPTGCSVAVRYSQFWAL